MDMLVLLHHQSIDTVVSGVHEYPSVLGSFSTNVPHLLLFGLLQQQLVRLCMAMSGFEWCSCLV
jgi:hypothetical protein